MKLKLSSQQRQQLVDWANEAGDQECCGLLLGSDDKVERVEQTANVAPDPNRRFEIDPAVLIAMEKLARRGGTAIIGYFHSHPNGRAKPSTDDEGSAALDGRYWLIIANGEITSWLPTLSDVPDRVSFVSMGSV